MQAPNTPPVMISFHKMKKSVSEFFPNGKQGCLSFKWEGLCLQQD